MGIGLPGFATLSVKSWCRLEILLDSGMFNENGGKGLRNP